MTVFEWYQFKDTELDLSADLPENTHLIIELTSGNLIYVEGTTQLKVYHFDTDTGTETQLDVDPSDSSGDNKSRDHKIQSLWHDRDNQIIWGVDCDNDGTADDFDVWKLDYSASETSPTVTEVGSSAGADANTVYAHDIFKIGANMYVSNTEERAAVKKWVVWDVDVAPFVEQDNTGIGAVGLWFSFGVVVGDDYWVCFDSQPVDTVYILKFDSIVPDLANKETIIDYSQASEKNLLGMAYDGVDTIYFICEKDADSKNYLMTYTISTNTIADTGNEYNVSLMLDRNCKGTSSSPWEFEKAFHLTNSYIYQFRTGKEYLLKIQDLGLTGGATIKAITDKYLIDSNKNVYECSDSLDNLTRCIGKYAIASPPRLQLEYDEEASTDQIFELYQDAGSGTYTKLFMGNVGVPAYNTKTGKFTFNMVNLGAKDLLTPVSYTAAAKQGNTCAKLLLSDSKVDFLYSSASYLKGSTNITYTWDTQRFRDCAYTIALRINGLWYYEAKGLFHLRSYSSMDNSSLEFSATNCFLAGYRRVQAQANIWDIDGGWDNTNSDYFNTRYVDSAHKQEHGPLEWKGRGNFTEARSQAATSATAVAMKSWTGMQGNPYLISIIVNNQAFIQPGMKCNFNFSFVSAFNSASSYCIVSNQVDFKSKRQQLTLAKSVVLRR
jgi:hypothetical protein